MRWWSFMYSFFSFFLFWSHSQDLSTKAIVKSIIILHNHCMTEARWFKLACTLNSILLLFFRLLFWLFLYRNQNRLFWWICRFFMYKKQLLYVKGDFCFYSPSKLTQLIQTCNKNDCGNFFCVRFACMCSK